MKQIDFNFQKEHFKTFLSRENNVRVIFSGIFGVGKTTFLNELFKENEEYIALHLYPTNYSVSKNKDIFELIKYDILYEILNHKPDLETFEVTTLDTLQFLSVPEVFRIFKSFVKCIPEIGKPTLEIIKPLEELLEILRQKKSEINDESEIHHLDRFAKKIEIKKGTLYESDFYTKLILKLISGLKSKYKKQVVLIVDDLDRIDPAHIFRILNIFAVHFDVKLRDEGNNKFGLDKIILCCDLDNIKNIFKNSYGSNVDFNGYVDKFYTNEVYYFDNKRAISDTIDDFIRSIKISGIRGTSISEGHGPLLASILFSMVYSNMINLRVLKNWHGAEISLSQGTCVLDDVGVDVNNLRIITLFLFLAKLFNGKESLLEVFENTNFSPLTELSRNIRALGDLIFLAEYKNHKFGQESELTFDSGFINYKYTIVGGYDGYWVKAKVVNKDGSAYQNSDFKIPYKDLLLRAYKNFLLGSIEKT